MNQNSLSSAEQRARAILDAYGSWPAAWPDDERQATLDCIAHSPILRRYQIRLETLDARIHCAQADALPAESELKALQQRILANLPAQPLPRNGIDPVSFWRKLLDRMHLRRYTLALASMVILVIVLTLHHSAPVVTPMPSPVTTFAAWSWYDITGQELPAKQTTAALTMTDLIDLEIDQDGS